MFRIYKKTDGCQSRIHPDYKVIMIAAMEAVFEPGFLGQPFSKRFSFPDLASSYPSIYALFTLSFKLLEE